MPENAQNIKNHNFKCPKLSIWLQWEPKMIFSLIRPAAVSNLVTWLALIYPEYAPPSSAKACLSLQVFFRIGAMIREAPPRWPRSSRAVGIPDVPKGIEGIKRPHRRREWWSRSRGVWGSWVLLLANDGSEGRRGSHVQQILTRVRRGAPDSGHAPRRGRGHPVVCGSGGAGLVPQVAHLRRWHISLGS